MFKCLLKSRLMMMLLKILTCSLSSFNCPFCIIIHWYIKPTCLWKILFKSCILSLIQSWQSCSITTNELIIYLLTRIKLHTLRPFLLLCLSSLIIKTLFSSHWSYIFYIIHIDLIVLILIRHTWICIKSHILYFYFLALFSTATERLLGALRFEFSTFGASCRNYASIGEVR